MSMVYPSSHPMIVGWGFTFPEAPKSQFRQAEEDERMDNRFSFPRLTGDFQLGAGVFL